MATPEARYVKRITTELTSRKAWWVKTTGQSSKVGCPDLLACYHGVFIAIEVKNEVGRASEAQQAQLARIGSAGGWTILAKGDEGVDLVKRVLDDIYETMVVR